MKLPLTLNSGVCIDEAKAKKKVITAKTDGAYKKTVPVAVLQDEF